MCPGVMVEKMTGTRMQNRFDFQSRVTAHIPTLLPLFQHSPPPSVFTSLGKSRHDSSHRSRSSLPPPSNLEKSPSQTARAQSQIQADLLQADFVRRIQIALAEVNTNPQTHTYTLQEGAIHSYTHNHARMQTCFPYPLFQENPDEECCRILR